MNPRILAEIYRDLAEVFYLAPGEHLPDWFASPGKDWPLLQSVMALARQRKTQSLENAVNAIQGVAGDSICGREQEYQSLFIGNRQPPIWLYGSYYLDGRVPGPTTFTISKLYSRIGLAVDGAELADHASIELAFLAFLAKKEIEDKAHAMEWRSVQRTFLHSHFKQWFPNVIRAIRSSNFPAWHAIGNICDVTFFFNGMDRKSVKTVRSTPALKNEANCTLCGFCFRVCPTQAFAIEENDNTTSLLLTPGMCNECEKCVKVCPEGVLILSEEPAETERVKLRESPVSRCPACKTPTISEAELSHVASKLGNPEWLFYCGECRTKSAMSC